MKTIWTILGTMMAASLIAQNNNNSLPAMPPPVGSPAAETTPATPAPVPAVETNKPAAPAKHRAVRKPVRHRHVMHEPSVSLPPGPAQVNASELIVRGQAGLRGEVVARLHQGETVNVLEQINLAHHAADEPAQWAKISFPTNADVWVNAQYISNGAVSTKKLNLRAGPGENYSVVGVVEQGTPVNQIETKGNWVKIEPPPSAYAFVAARYLTPVTVAVAPPPPPPTPTEVAPPTPIITAPPPPQPPPTPPVRIVQHEGVVEPVGSPTAPTDYKLYDPNTRVDEDFLYPTSPNMDFSQLVNDRVIVTGEEGLEKGWPNTPVMAVQDVQVVATNVVKQFSREELIPPRLRH
jgi:uncharacterized protein YgiM (DUF1202 family)